MEFRLLIGSLMLFLMAGNALSQEVTSVQPPNEKTGTVRSDLGNGTMDEKLAAQQEQIDELIEQVAALSERLDDAETAHAAAEIETAENREAGVLDVYGFLTAQFTKSFLPKDSPLQAAMLHHSYFAVTDMNVYFSSHLTQHLNALLELGFTFMPHGSESSLIPYERVDTTVLDLRVGHSIQLGGVFIERAKMVWQPRDFFGVTVGRFFTPYGIWNQDHGATVVLTTRLPYLVVRQGIPLAQTGVAVQGTLFPGDHSRLEYGVTLSNGRGPTESAYDLNENKALGARLKGFLEFDKVLLSLGAYGYFGDGNDSVKALDLASSSFSDVDKSAYREMAGALDGLVEIGGLRLQSEFVRTVTHYSKRPVSKIPEVNIELPGEYQPDYYQWDVYGLVAYDFYVGQHAVPWTITPYAMVERSVFNDIDPDTSLFMYTVGVTAKPLPSAALKLNGTVLYFPDSDFITGQTWSINAQMSVGF